MNYHGKDQYKTRVGAVITILSLTSVGVLSSFKVINLVTRSDPAITTMQVFWDLPNDVGNVSAQEIGFDLAYWYHSEDYSEMLTAQYDLTYFMPAIVVK